MEVAVESPRPAAWDQFKEEVEIMEEEHGGAAAAAAAADAAGELLTREIKKRLLDHARANGNGHGHGHVNGGEAEELKPPQAEEEKEEPELQAPEEEEEEVPQEPKVAEEEEQQHKTIFFDTAKVPDIITEVSAKYLVTATTRSDAEKEGTNETPNTKVKEPEAQENGNAPEINHGPSNGKLENGSHSNGSHQVPNGSEPNIEFMFEINKTEIYPTEVDKDDKDEHVTEAQPKVEEYDLQKILDQQETHDLYCPNCKSCITRRVILKKRKRTVRPAIPDGPSKRPYTEVVLEPLPSASLPGSDEQESPDVFRCLSCFAFFIPTGGRFNIFRIFGRRGLDQQVDVLPPPASEDMLPPSENCTSWLLSCFQPGDSPNQPDPAGPLTVPLLSGTHSADNTTTITESSTSYVHHSHGTVVKPEQSTVESPSENQAAPDPLTVPLLPGTQISDNTTTTTESSTSYVHHSHGMIVKPEHSTTESPSENQAAPDPMTVPLLSGTQNSNNTTTTTESSTSYVHQSHDMDVKPEQSIVESPSGKQATPVTMPPLSDAQSPNDTTTTTESSTSYVHHSQGTVVKPEHSTVESSSEQTTTTTTTTTTTATATSSSTTTSEAANTSSHTSSATGIFHTDTLEVITGEMPPPKPAGGAIMDANHHLLGHEDVHRTATTALENGFTTHASYTSGVKVGGPNLTNIARGEIPTSPFPQAAHSPHVAVAVSEDVILSAPTPQQRDEWDILKAIVYGGLVESVTSLSVVSAAASSGAKTLDIFILGIANLIGGLPLIFHNIADLRDIRDVDGDNERVGHYWLLLGRRSKARLHMILALLSYIVFGLLPPVLYGLSFRESNDRENKMMAVAAASLPCIALLALGKAHVHRRPRTYFKTLMYYLTIAVSSSGLSYVAGELITRLLAHFGIIEQGGSAAPAPPGLSFPHSVGAQTSAWASF